MNNVALRWTLDQSITQRFSYSCGVHLVSDESLTLRSPATASEQWTSLNTVLAFKVECVQSGAPGRAPPADKSVTARRIFYSKPQTELKRWPAGVIHVACLYMCTIYGHVYKGARVVPPARILPPIIVAVDPAV